VVRFEIIMKLELSK